MPVFLWLVLPAIIVRAPLGIFNSSSLSLSLRKNPVGRLSLSLAISSLILSLVRGSRSLLNSSSSSFENPPSFLGSAVPIASALLVGCIATPYPLALRYLFSSLVSPLHSICSTISVLERGLLSGKSVLVLNI